MSMEDSPFGIRDSVALVTGANRGLGQAFVQALLAAGVRKIYAAAREPAQVALAERVIPLRLDVTNHRDVEEALAKCQDISLLINNAGIIHWESALDPLALALAGAEWETNVIGPLRLIQSFAPVLRKNGGGAILNVLSALTWVSLPGGPAMYSATKAALWSLTNSLRTELRSQGTQVSALHVAFLATDMTQGRQLPKAHPLEVAKYALTALQGGEVEILADGLTRQLKQALSSGVYLSPPKQG
jgi:NAD(P)-dependent dehydrogenase (short-subunit alcohol dehydrogenase family)